MRRRIAADPELSARYGDGAEPPTDGPTDSEAMGRTPADLATVRPAIDLVDPITALDLENYRTALRAHGIAESTLTKLKALDGLASDGAKLLAVSFRVSHQSYVGQLHHLDEVADSVKERMKGTLLPDGTYQPLEVEEHAGLAKVYVECVKERGKGMGMIMSGIEAIVRMTKGAGTGAPDAGKLTPGWGPMKKVAAAPAQHAVD